MAQELLCYQPTDDGREGWRARIAELIAIANEDPAQGGAPGVGEPDPAAGTAPRAPEMGRPPRPRKWFPVPHLRRAGSPAAKSFNALRKTHASPLSAVAKIMTAPSTTSARLARMSGPPVTLSTTPGVLLSLASSAMWSSLTSSSRTSARITTGPLTPSNSSSSTSSLSRPRVEVSVPWPIGSQWPSRMLRGLGS
jgi:hypothetical protein